MIKLLDLIKKRNIPDVEDIIEEYEQHFNYKLNEGYRKSSDAAFSTLKINIKNRKKRISGLLFNSICSDKIK